jgi:adenosylhomocysteine nucleosidase
VSDLCAPDGTEFLTHVDDAALRSARVVIAAIGSLAG